MQSQRPGRSILVPILDDDITEATLAEARAALTDAGDARVVLLHVFPDEDGAVGAATVVGAPEPNDGRLPRWRCLAAAARPGRVYDDVVTGDPASAIVAQAGRFGSDAIFLGRPERATPRAAWIERVITQVRRAEPARARVAVDRPVRAPRDVVAGRFAGPELARAPVG